MITFTWKYFITDYDVKWAAGTFYEKYKYCNATLNDATEMIFQIKHFPAV